MCSTAAKKSVASPVRYSDISARLWIWSGAPLQWRDKVDVEFVDIGFFELEPANTLKHWDVLACWTRAIARGRTIPPLVVSRTGHGTYYVHDGNHRMEAMRICFRNRLSRLRVRAAVVNPKPGYQFVYRWFRNYGTYVLAPTNFEYPEISIPEVAPAAAVAAVANEASASSWSA